MQPAGRGDRPAAGYMVGGVMHTLEGCPPAGRLARTAGMGRGRGGRGGGRGLYGSAVAAGWPVPAWGGPAADRGRRRCREVGRHLGPWQVTAVLVEREGAHPAAPDDVAPGP